MIDPHIIKLVEQAEGTAEETHDGRLRVTVEGYRGDWPKLPGWKVFWVSHVGFESTRWTYKREVQS